MGKAEERKKEKFIEDIGIISYEQEKERQIRFPSIKQ